MMAKWFAPAFIGLVILVVGIASANAQQAPAQQKWKGVAVSRPTPQFEIFQWFNDELAKRTNGQLTGELVSLPELGLTGYEAVRVTRAGLVDYVDTVISFVAGDAPVLEAVDLPGLYQNYEASVKAHAAFLPAVKKYEEKIGGVMLGGYLWPGQYIFSRKPIRTPADLKGLKIRVYGAAQTDLVSDMGISPVVLPLSETYTALDRGAADAAITGSYTAFAIKLFEVAKYIVDINHGPNFAVLMVSKRSWDKLSSNQQAILRKLGDEFTERGWEVGRRSDKEGLDKLREKGMEFIPATPAMAAAVTDTLKRVVLPNWLKRAGPDGKVIFNQYLTPQTGITVP